MIHDEQQFNGAKTESGYEILTYDDGYGPLWISRNSIGINGIVRARTWEDAYEICEDEFFSEADETVDDLIKEFGFERKYVKVVKDSSVTIAVSPCNAGERLEVYPDDYPGGKLAPEFVRWETIETPNPDAWTENELFQEAYGFRPNGANSRDVLKHGIYQKDLNGDSLDMLTPEMLEDLRITLDISQYIVIVGNIGHVYQGSNRDEAMKHFNEYVSQSKSGIGRAGNEEVTVMHLGDVIEEYQPEQPEEED